jgi:FPC/CPF motif-containing protein YcgG
MTTLKKLPPERQAALAQQFNNFVLDPDYPCLGAKSAFRTDSYHVRSYRTLGSDITARALGPDLRRFIAAQSTMNHAFTTFVAIFDDPSIRSEVHFEQLLWQQLDALHRADEHPWTATASSDPSDNNFGFSFGGVAFFVVGMHPLSARQARRFVRPALVFNDHRQFEQLRAQGNFPKMQRVIRERDEAWQGTTNPMLADFGTASEARQYSGRAVPATWKCPFHAKSSA